MFSFIYHLIISLELCYFSTEFPVQMYWCGNAEVNKERFCQQDVGPDFQYSQTHRSARKRGIEI